MELKRLLSFCYLLSLFTDCFGQDLSDTIENHQLTGFKSDLISIAAPLAHITLHHIGNIDIWDARPDTSTIGVSQIGTKKPYFIYLNGGLTQAAVAFVKQYATCSLSDSTALMAVIRNMWIGNELYLDHEYVNWDIKKYQNYGCMLVAQIDFYVKKGSDYYAVFRYDSLMNGDLPELGDVSKFLHLDERYSKGNIKKGASELLRKVLTASFAKLETFDSKSINIAGTKRKFTIQEIKRYYAKPYEIPILKDSSLKRGVYCSFDEFKNNSPSQPNYVIKRRQLSDKLTVIGPDSVNLSIENIWGYSDGEHAYIQMFDNYFILKRLQNSFYLHGAMDIRYKNLPSVGSNPSRNPSYSVGSSYPVLNLRPYVLNWNTGKPE